MEDLTKLNISELERELETLVSQRKELLALKPGIRDPATLQKLEEKIHIFEMRIADLERHIYVVPKLVSRINDDYTIDDVLQGVEKLMKHGLLSADGTASHLDSQLKKIKKEKR